MTDWSRFSHAYGSAKDIPDLLDRAEAGPDAAEAWSDLWSALCHQGTVYPASYAALPRLAALAAGGATGALDLAAAIVGSSDRPDDADDVLGGYVAEIAALLRITNERLRAPAALDEYISLLEMALALEGTEVWSEQLGRLLDEEYEVSCPGCELSLFIAIGERGHFASSGDYALGEVERTPLSPAGPGDLRGLGRRLYRTALGDGQEEVALKLTYLFGGAACTGCGASFTVADRVAAGA